MSPQNSWMAYNTRVIWLLGTPDFVRMIIRGNKSMQEPQPGQLASESDHSTSKGNTFVKAVGGKARTLLKTLERSFSSSTTEKGEDISYMTIEFLYMRLQAQRTVYKAEKQRVQQLVQKVMELEQMLNLEIARRKEAEGDNVPVSSKYGSCYLGATDPPYCKVRSCMMEKAGEEKGVNVGSCLDEGYTTEQHAGWISGIKNQIDGCAVHHTNGGELYQSLLLCHQCECHRSHCKQVPIRGWSSVDIQSNATCNQNSSETSMQKGTRESMDPHFKEEGNSMLEMTQRNLNTKVDKYGADSWSEVYEIDIDDLEESDGNKVTFSNVQGTPGLSHRLPSGGSPRKAVNLQQPAKNSSAVESLECSSLGSSSNLASEGTSRELLQKCSARAISSPREYHERALEGIMSSPKKLNLGAFTDLSISSMNPREHSLYNDRQAPKRADERSLYECIMAESESSKEIEEYRQVANQRRKQDFEGKQVMAVHPPNLLKTVCSHEKWFHKTKHGIY